jgi:DNA-binding LacI/PurR family transcriptional regulator
MSSLLALPEDDRPTAVIVYNDIMAIGALHAIRDHHLSVPDDISVIGCDGIAGSVIWFSRTHRRANMPRLRKASQCTTVAVP